MKAIGSMIFEMRPGRLTIRAVITSTASVFVIIPTLCLAQQPLMGGPLPSRLGDSSSGRCDVNVCLKPDTVGPGDSVTVEFNISCRANLYNAFLSSGNRLSGQVTIYAADRKLRSELIQAAFIPLNNPELSNHWSRLPERGVVGRQLTITLANEAPEQGDRLHTPISIYLPPGEYYIQAAFNHWLLAGNFDDTGKWTSTPQPRPGFSEARMNESLAVSEPVKLIVTGKTTQVANDKVHSSDGRSDSPIRLELMPDKIVEKAGRVTEYQLRMINQSQQVIEFYNPFLNGLLWNTLPLKLVVLSEDGVTIGDLYVSDVVGSSRGPGPTDWLAVPPSGFVSTKRSLVVGRVPGTDFDGSIEYLPPGKYFLELRAYAPLVTGCPKVIKQPTTDDLRNLREFQEWRLSLPGPEICRSNRVELEILPRTGD